MADGFYKELMLTGGYSENDRWQAGSGTLKNSVGFEYFKKQSNDYGDLWTFDLQVRAAYNDNFNQSDAFGVEIHNAWLEYNLGLGKSLTIGHFDPAFGLEPVLDTHGTLLQTLALKNIGYKKDWGISYKGFLGDYDYQLAAQLGSGMGIRRQDGSYLFTARIAEPQTKDSKFGISFLFGKTLQSKQSWTIPAAELAGDCAVEKKRIGIDYQGTLGILDFKTEAAVGDNDGTAVGGIMAELGFTVPEEQNIKVKIQGMYWSDDRDRNDKRDLTLAPVIEYILNPESTVRLGYFHDIYSRNGNDRAVMLQFYYYGL